MGLGTPPLLRTPLHAVHRDLGARMVDFAGWDMPVQYPSGIIAEHAAVRSACGMFDLSHMGRVFVRGVDALTLVQACCTRDIAAVPDGQAAYALLCLPDGGILDDVIVYRLDPREILLIVNASNREADLAWLTDQCERLLLSADVDDATLETALIGVQGPQAQAALQPLCSVELEAMGGYAFDANARVAGHSALVARTGYTGEDGFEVLTEAEHAARVWRALVDGEGARPCGLGARDTLRTEAAMPLYGHDIDEFTNPFEARLGWAVQLDKPDFLGRDALLALKSQPVARRLVGLLADPGGVPRPTYPISAEGRAVGAVTSGTFSPTLQRNIALGYVASERGSVGTRLEIEVRGRPVGAEVVKLPFVAHRTRPRSTM
jgi:aminomethyltransferase